MLMIRCNEHFHKVVSELQDNPEALKSLINKIAYLTYYGEGKFYCELYSDFNPLDFSFSVYNLDKNDNKDAFRFNGGLIYHEHSNSYGIHT